MIKILSLFQFLTALGPFAASAAETEKTVPDFYIVKTARDPALKASEAIVEFQFSNTELGEHAFGQYPVLYASANGNAFQIPLTKELKYELKVVPGTYVFQFFATFDYLEIYSDSVVIEPGFRTTAAVHFTRSDRPIMMDKPVIYLYPETDTDVTTVVEPKGSFQFTYPRYDNGWKGTAHSDGSITIAGKTYPYLFWDAVIESAFMDTTKGFIVSAGQLIPFFEEKLAAIGLTVKEQTDFITYWVPRMTANTANFIQFAWGDDCNAFAEMTVTPQPDHVNRLYMLWSDATNVHTEAVYEQELPVFDRSGFDVLEWGGMEVPTHTQQL